MRKGISVYHDVLLPRSFAPSLLLTTFLPNSTPRCLVCEFNDKKLDAMNEYARNIHLLNEQVNKATDKLRRWHHMMKSGI